MTPQRTTFPDGTTTLEHELEVPLDHADPSRGTLTVFAREVVAPGGEHRPHLVFLQGGPGSEATRPTFGPTAPGWVAHALRHFRVVLLDQRGTGRSTPVGEPADLGATPQEQADRLALFRADAIVADAELLRAHLGVERWSVLGQSFGGFCLLHYLSVAPGSLAAGYFTGGLPPVARPVDDVYAATYPTVLERNRLFHERYPADRDRVRRVHDLAAEGRIVLPGGDRLTPARLRNAGSVLGMSYGAETMHHLLELDPLSRAFRHDLAHLVPWGGRNPLYTLLQESCYADGTTTGWAAARTLPEEFRADPTLFVGEHVFPETIADDSELAPLAGAADLLAHRAWPRLYDADALGEVDVPCAAAVYARDPYVDATLSLETAALVPTLSTWVTDEHEHDGLRTSPEVVLDHLFALAPPPA
ncbi:alpha/beta fold hydrolase [Nocardioides sp. Leaf374]|uniref:alpha/beta fold hydrolase n=1 Tax=Nocardioides sp. Leaf374 TaxID=2876560 RepID=UPI001E4FDB01|nr:alpha/beta fold hydrolase [Nocardioides sp. Leaf374]